MSSPSTKRDQRRESRRAQFQERQEERRRARERARRAQLTKRIAIVAVTVLVIGLLVWGVVAHFATASSTSTPGVQHPATGTNTHPATGQVVDGISCMTSEGSVQHYHAQLYVYVNGQNQPVPTEIGIPNGQCLYALHTHDASGIIHIESPDNSPYVLGNLFDIWGQPLSTTNFMGHQVGGANKLVIDVYDANGKMTVYTGNPLDLKLAEHQTIYLLYDSPNVKTAPFTQWGSL
jgi:dipeptidyl aminopeptidase/acylaminoacyl peptidase